MIEIIKRENLRYDLPDEWSFIHALTKHITLEEKAVIRKLNKDNQTFLIPVVRNKTNFWSLLSKDYIELLDNEIVANIFNNFNDASDYLLSMTTLSLRYDMLTQMRMLEKLQDDSLLILNKGKKEEYIKMLNFDFSKYVSRKYGTENILF